jgi:adenylate cyclase
VKVRDLEQQGRREDADKELEIALRLGEKSWEVNREAARLMFKRERMADAIRYYEKAWELMDGDFHSIMMLITCYLGVQNEEAALDAARRAFETVERVLAKDANNGGALAAGASALMMLGEVERGKDWVQRALLLDPDNIMVLYNAACSLTFRNLDLDGALDLLEQYFGRLESPGNIHHAEIDPDMDPVRNDPRFKTMLASAKRRLGVQELKPASPSARTA